MASEKFKEWVRVTPRDKRQHVADTARTSVAFLGHLASGYRNASSQLAARVETAAEGELTRADVNDTCASCPYFQKCQNPESK